MIAPREVWAAVETQRRRDESWFESCERQMLEAMQAEHLTQERMAEMLSCALSTLNHKLEKWNLRPRPKKRRAA